MSANGCIAQGLVVGGVLLLEHHSTQVECLREEYSTGAAVELRRPLTFSLTPKLSLIQPLPQPSFIPPSSLPHPSLTPLSSIPHPSPIFFTNTLSLSLILLSTKTLAFSPPYLLPSPSSSHLVEESVRPEF